MVGLEDGPAIERDREVGDAIGAEHRLERGDEFRERDEIRERLRDEQIRTVLVEGGEGVTRVECDCEIVDPESTIGVDDIVIRVTKCGRSDVPGKGDSLLVSVDTAVRSRIDTPRMESGNRRTGSTAGLTDPRLGRKVSQQPIAYPRRKRTV